MTKRNLHQDRVASENESLAEEARDAERRSELDEQETARQRAEEFRRKAEMEKAKPPAELETPKSPPVFSVASRPPVDLSREDGEPLGDIPAPWVYTLIGMDGSIGGALMADADAEWLDVGPHHLRVEMVPVPTLPRGIPVVFLPPAMIPEVADPKVSPPDVFSGQTGLAGTANEALMRNYHNRPDSGPKAKVARRVVYADPSKPAPKSSKKVADAA